MDEAYRRAYQQQRRFASRQQSVLGGPGTGGVDPSDPYGGKDVKIPGRDPMKQQQVLQQKFK